MTGVVRPFERRGGPARVAVLVSGSGTNLQALLDAAADPLYPADIRVVVSNRPGVRALERASEARVDAEVVDHRAFATRDAFEEAVLAVLARHAVDIVCLAGFMRVLTPRFLDAFPLRVLNIHPALLPAFPGVRAPRQAVDYGVKVAGCTVHFVTAGVDEGPIIAQAAVPVYDDDDEAALAARILPHEHRLYPLALRWVAEGRCRVEGRRVYVDGA